jgi:hypothetical protein
VVEWLTDHFWWLTAAGILMSVGGLGVLLALAITMPADHFAQPHQMWDGSGRHPVVRVAMRVAKNVVGAILFVLGLIMAVPGVPGPGLLFIVLGVSLMDIPGKHAAIHYIVSRPLVLRPINALRARCKRPPLQVPPDPRATGGQP